MATKNAPESTTAAAAPTTTAPKAKGPAKQPKKEKEEAPKVVAYQITLTHPKPQPGKLLLCQVICAVCPQSETKFVVSGTPAPPQAFHAKVIKCADGTATECAGDDDLTVAVAISAALGLPAYDSTITTLETLCHGFSDAKTADEILPHVVAFNSHLAAGGPWCCGIAPTVWDARLYSVLASNSAFAPNNKNPRTSAWFASIKRLPGLHVAPAPKPKATTQPNNTATTATTSSTASTAPTAAAPQKSLMGSQGQRRLVGVKGETETETEEIAALTGGDSLGSGVVVTRFPPEPSGYLHIGHIKAALLNDYYARHYQGKLLLRFDDTNPSKEKVEYIESIIADLKTVGIVADAISYTSDHFDMLREKAEKLIAEGKAYVDNISREAMKAGRKDGIESPCRNQTVEQNMALWSEMLSGTPEGQKCVLRAKIDMQNPNKVLRDPSLWRCNSTPHHRTGTKYASYPLYDFAIPIVDCVEGVTHALRSSEYHDRNALYYWVPKVLGIRSPIIEDFSRLNFAYVLLSKRKLQWFVDNGIVDGWDDPRFPTVQGLIRRGLSIQAMRAFALSQGGSKSLNLMSMEKLWTTNKKVIDPIVPRYTAVSIEPQPCILTITDAPEAPWAKSQPKHKKNASLGTKMVTYYREVYIEPQDLAELKVGEEVTLMDWGNVIIDSLPATLPPTTPGPTPTPAPTLATPAIRATAHLNPGGSFKKTKKLTWVAAALNENSPLQVTLTEYDHLITVKKLEEGQDFTQFINPVSVQRTVAVGDSNLRLVPRGTQMQLERRGYYVCDQPCIPKGAQGTETPAVLVMTPEGSGKASPFCKISLMF
ncbi:glutamine--tRNA ligase [Pelomyxa schiedti]|nr:glutamine--tRNA ligase [Pelomyxa schiedti]